MATYRPAPDLARRAEPIIRKHHTHLLDLDHDVTFVWRDKASKTRGKVVLGKARKVSGLNAALIAIAESPEKGFSQDADHDRFVIEIAEDEWADLNEAQRDALIDHELTHLTIDYDEDTGAITLALRAHDVEEFAEIVARHGAWEPGLARLVHAQQTLFDADGTPSEAPSGEAMADALHDAVADGHFDRLADSGFGVEITTSDGRTSSIGDVPPEAA